MSYMGVIYRVFSDRKNVSDCLGQQSTAWQSNLDSALSESVCFIIITTLLILWKTIKSISNITEIHIEHALHELKIRS